MVFGTKFKCKVLEGKLDNMHVYVKGQKERSSVCKTVSADLKMSPTFKKKYLQVTYMKMLLE